MKLNIEKSIILLLIWNKTDRNPFALKIEGLNKPQPNHGINVMRPTGWENKIYNYNDLFVCLLYIYGLI